MNSLTDWERELALLENKSNLRKLPVIRHLGREVEVNGKVMLNLSSNDYLGLAAYLPLRTEFLQSLTPDTFLPSSSSLNLNRKVLTPGASRVIFSTTIKCGRYMFDCSFMIGNRN